MHAKFLLCSLSVWNDSLYHISCFQLSFTFQIHLATILKSLFCRAEIARLTKVVELKTKEMNRVKRLAKNILDQVGIY